jgi:hypothetical protein
LADAVICRECGGLLHVGLRHECLQVATMEEGLRRVRRAQRARATFAAAGLSDPIGPYEANVRANLDDLLNAPRPPIRVVATVGAPIACRVAGCRLHNPDNLRASDEQVSA